MSFSVFSAPVTQASSSAPSASSNAASNRAYSGQAIAIKLVDNGVYQEFLTVHPVTAPVDIHHLSFTSQFANARNPDALQTRYQLNLSRATLAELNRFLTQYLALTQEADHVCN